ncbi:type II toxin-antitoxin system ParD family antitoxin [Acidisoma cellulosilytica]|uniref:Type II toxin-antitoxin system ParD family antitoxin n=1 Tax=Acidisoma cellulosilyticum TaxID=2802395 RepID=A0A963YZ21_9PROT|nr:type II toxin-antitoxin system ParD family antitoxin [Acidisoma cellulosilyticum]MCB8879685.1 type II toxin-antitoxin system ParD family antitoxin [Acidisoma cellulosilyticum]
MTDISVSLPPDLIRFITARIESGRATSSSDVVRDALQFLESAERAKAVAQTRLQRAWSDGVATVDVGEIDIEALKAEARQRLAVAG